jgi:peptidoglycan hydrolase-like protein with peptidoglycan-binding domain
MNKFLTISAALFLAALAAVGCGRKEPQDLSMPMSINVEGAPTTNLITKTGVPVEAGSTLEAPFVSESAPAVAESYVAPGVEEIQQALKNAGLYAGAVDGKIGPMTKKAITEFQQQSGLTADGKVGPKTWEKLKTYLNQNQ